MESKDGLYYINGNPSKKNTCFVNTLRENKSMFSKRQWQRAVEARATYHKVVTPSIKDYKSLVRYGLLKNMPVTIDDINIAEEIFGPDLSALQGKSTRKKPITVINDEIDIPEEILKRLKDLDMEIDIMFINGIAFLVTTTLILKFRTITYSPSRKKKAILEALDEVFRIYNKAEFNIVNIRADNEFN